MHDKITEWVNRLKVTSTWQTVDSYERHLRALDKTAPDRQPEDWTKADLLEYLAGRRAAGNGDSAIKQKVGAFRSFFGYACGDNSPAKDIPYPKVHRRLQRVLSPDDVLKVMAACDTSTDVGTRNLAIITLMLDTGLRASEVCNLKLAKVNFEKRRVVVIIKGGNEAVGVFSQATAGNLARWVAIRSKYARPECDTLFVSVWGDRPGTTMTREGLRAIFTHIGKRAGVRFSPHDLRRTFATLAIRNGAPTRVVQAAGRWGDVGMVERYTPTITAEDFDPYSPVEALLNYNRKERAE